MGERNCRLLRLWLSSSVGCRDLVAAWPRSADVSDTQKVERNSCLPLPLSSGDFHGAEWEEELAEYQREHPRLRVVDAFDAIRPIMSRATMLAPLEPNGIELRVSNPRGANAAFDVRC